MLTRHACGLHDSVGTVPSPTVVIAGGGLAAVTLVQSLRQRDFDGELLVLSGDGALPYDRPPLSKDVLRGERSAPLLVQPADWADLHVDLRLGRNAVGLDPERRAVLVDDGTEVAYDVLVVATGATPRRLDLLDGPGVFVLRTQDDAAALGAAIRHSGHLVIVGGGFVGCEVAASARALGARVVLIEQQELPLTAALGPVVAAELTALHVAAGVDVRAGATIHEVRGDGADRVLLLSDGNVVPASVVLVGIGVTADTGWLAGSGIEIDNGVVCDQAGRASLPDLWAVGDVASWWLPSLAAHRRIEHWTNAMEQAEVVARGLLGEDASHNPVPYVWTEQYGVTYQLAGLPASGDEVTMVPGDQLVAVYGEAGRCTAVLVGGAPRMFNRLRKLLRANAFYDDVVASARL